MHDILTHINNDFFVSHNSDELQKLIEKGIIDKKVVKNTWLGYPPATEEQIRKKEKLLGVTLPSSYREFLLTSNGFRYVSFSLNNLFSLDLINWAKNTEEEWWFDLLEECSTEVSDEKYFDYGPEQDTLYDRPQYIRESVKVSEWYDGMCVFLNPNVKHGLEWEVLVYATWYPGTARYRSFKEYLIATHEANVRSNSRSNNCS